MHIPQKPCSMQSDSGTAIVLTGGGARGAYEVGVLLFLLERAERGRAVFDTFTGTSVGALNACFMAAMAHDPARGARELATYWRSLTMDRVLRFGCRQLMELGHLFVGGSLRKSTQHKRPALRAGSPHPPVAGVFSVEPLRADLMWRIPWPGIQKNIAAGHLRGVALCATEVCTGRSVVFYQHGDRCLYRRGGDPARCEHQVPIQIDHAMASSAIPFVFPAVQIDGICYMDGALRQNTPLNPAIRMGARKILVVSLSESPEARYQRARIGCHRNPYPGPLFLLGRTVASVMDGVIDHELQGIEMFNKLIESGTATFGDDFITEINRITFPIRQAELGHIRTLHIRPSQPLAELASAALRQAPREFRIPGTPGPLLEWLLKSTPLIESDLTGYLLFTPSHLRQLVDLGYHDAQQRRDELEDFLAA